MPYLPEDQNLDERPNKNIPKKTPFIGGGNDNTSWNLERQSLAKIESAKLKTQIPIEKKKTSEFLVKIRNFMYNLIHKN